MQLEHKRKGYFYLYCKATTQKTKKNTLSSQNDTLHLIMRCLSARACHVWFRSFSFYISSQTIFPPAQISY